MFSRPRSFHRFTAVAAALLLGSAGSARADLITFSGSRGGTDPVSFSGTMELTGSTLKITLDNTTSSGDAVSYGYITGFGFNLPINVTATPVGNTSPFNFLSGSNPNQSTTLQPNSGSFDYAFSLSPTQLHTAGVLTNTQIAQGIDAGDTPVTFTLLLSGNLTGLTAAQIIQESTSGGRELSVRFRSTNNTKYSGSYGDGDKVETTYWKDITPPPPSGVPAPPGLVLAGMGIGGLLLGRLRLRRTPAAPQA